MSRHLGDDDVTPQSSERPDELPVSEARRLERLLGRKRSHVELALAARLRNETSDPYEMVAQLALDVHDLKKPISMATKAVFALLAATTGAAVYVGSAIWGASERNTAVEYRLRACEDRSIRLENALYPPLYPSRALTPVHEPTTQP